MNLKITKYKNFNHCVFKDSFEKVSFRDLLNDEALVDLAIQIIKEVCVDDNTNKIFQDKLRENCEIIYRNIMSEGVDEKVIDDFYNEKYRG